MKTKNMNQADNRLACPCCGVKTWSKDFTSFMKNHDRVDGRVCRKAQAVIKKVLKLEAKP